MAKVNGSREGLIDTRNLSKNVGPLISVEEMKNDYLFGIDLQDQQGNPFTPEMFQSYINSAISLLEHELDIHIVPYRVVEDRDYILNWYADWGYMTLNEYPVVNLISMEMIYFEDANNNPTVIQTIPNEWIRLQDHDGMIRLIPNARFPANLQVDNSGNFFPEVLRSTMVPNLWRFTYTAGFEDGKVPNLINQAIGLLASIQAMSLGGIQVFGPGVAAKSISLDGLSQSISTTNNAANAAYSQVIAEYKDLLYGRDKEMKSGIINTLRYYYKGAQLGII